MKELKPVFIIVLLAIFVCSNAMLFHEQQASLQGQDTYMAALELATEGTAGVSENTSISPPRMVAAQLGSTVITDDPNLEFLMSIDLDALQEVNPDVIGWFYIPGTNISYPLLQDDNNEYYMDYTWDNKASYVGSILMECRSDPSLTDFNTIVYGHNLKNKTMFSHLHMYKQQSFWEAYPYVYIVTEQGIYRYQIFAAFEVPATSNVYRLRFHDESQKSQYIDDSLAWNTLETGITPTTEDRILTLSTCTGVVKTNRWVVQAVFEGQLTDADDAPGNKFSHGLHRYDIPN